MYLRQQLEEQGFAFITKYAPDLSALEIAEKIGRIACLPNVDSFQMLTPKQEHESGPNTYSGSFGLGAFPLHSDLAHWHEPPRYLVLRCVTGTSDVYTSVVNAKCVISEIGELALSRALVIPRRPTQQNNCLLRLLTKHDSGTDMFRWDEMFIKPASKSSSEIFKNVSQLLQEAQLNKFVLGHPGDTLVVDNWRMLHGRSPVPNNSKTRHIERVYLKEVN